MVEEEHHEIGEHQPEKNAREAEEAGGLSKPMERNGPRKDVEPIEGDEQQVNGFWGEQGGPSLDGEIRLQCFRHRCLIQGFQAVSQVCIHFFAGISVEPHKRTEIEFGFDLLELLAVENAAVLQDVGFAEGRDLLPAAVSHGIRPETISIQAGF